MAGTPDGAGSRRKLRFASGTEQLMEDSKKSRASDRGVAGPGSCAREDGTGLMRSGSAPGSVPAIACILVRETVWIRLWGFLLKMDSPPIYARWGKSPVYGKLFPIICPIIVNQFTDTDK